MILERFKVLGHFKNGGRRATGATRRHGARCRLGIGGAIFYHKIILAVTEQSEWLWNLHQSIRNKISDTPFKTLSELRDRRFSFFFPIFRWLPFNESVFTLYSWIWNKINQKSCVSLQNSLLIFENIPDAKINVVEQKLLIKSKNIL